MPGFAIEQNQDKVFIDALNRADTESGVPDAIANDEWLAGDEFHHFHITPLSSNKPRFRRGTVFFYPPTVLRADADTSSVLLHARAHMG